MHRFAKVPVVISETTWERLDVVCEHEHSTWGVALSDDLTLVRGSATSTWVAAASFEAKDLPDIVTLLKLTHITRTLEGA